MMAQLLINAFVSWVSCVVCMQLATLAEIYHTNFPSLKAVLKAGRKAGYRYVSIFYTGGPCCLLGYEDAILTPGLFANLKFECVFDPLLVHSLCVWRGGRSLLYISFGMPTYRMCCACGNLLVSYMYIYRYASRARKVG